MLAAVGGAIGVLLKYTVLESKPGVVESGGAKELNYSTSLSLHVVLTVLPHYKF